MGLCDSNPPPAPDYTGAALQQGQENVATAKTQGQINNPNVVNPYGTQTTTYGTGINQPAYDAAQQQYQQQLSAWQQAGGVDRVQIGMSRNQPVYRDTPKPQAPTAWDYATGDPNQLTLTQKLSPEQQGLYDQQVKTQGLLGGLAQQGATSLQGVVGKPVDFSGSPARPDPGQMYQQAVAAMMQRPTADYNRAVDQSKSDLASAGIPVGSQAYNTQQDLLGRQLTDAQTQASLAGINAGNTFFNQGQAARSAANAENLTQRQTPLNEITALLSGSQVSNPFTMPGYAQNTQVQAAPLYNAAQQTGQYGTDVYNAKQAQQSALMSGLFGLGGSALTGAGAGIGAAYSDRRLKSNIQRVGTHRLGIGIYAYDLDGQRQLGVMADEVRLVKPEAVLRGADGYDRVFYGRL
jgi:hypothetical protein